MPSSDKGPINIGTGADITIADLARVIADIVGYKGQFVFDASKPDGTPRKLLDVFKLTALGWRRRIDLEVGYAEPIIGTETSSAARRTDQHVRGRKPDRLPAWRLI